MNISAKLYIKAIIRLSERQMFEGREHYKEFMKRYITLGVKYFLASYGCSDYTAMMARFNISEYIKAYMAQLTPKEFMQLFPINKTYDGAKNERKDYFSTMEFIRSLEQDKPIGGSKALESFLWEYWNWDINMFVAETYGLLNDIMNMRGQAGPLDKVMEDIPLLEISGTPASNLTHLHVVCSKRYGI